MDLFVPLHLFGWWIKTLLLRDMWLCWVISVMFEILEYTLEHQLPNFSECWWDHVSNYEPCTLNNHEIYGPFIQNNQEICGLFMQNNQRIYGLFI